MLLKFSKAWHQIFAFGIGFFTVQIIVIVKEIAVAPFNGVSKEWLEIEEKDGTNICNEKKLQQLLEQNNRYICGDVGP
ncbi:12499_t:CDS:2 [Racocetra fulgida]|uniref:12499_t:CDS:1 n=1 Tax=Racocetra fulgida TaxID=60492 RepID=A0A9N8WGW0_9GLOM|nr:12499_t:CDS:2 [Racocetra fulgida]